MKAILEKIGQLRLRTGLGVFARDATVHRVQASRTPLGVVLEDRDTPDLWTIISEKARVASATMAKRLPPGVTQRLPKIGQFGRVFAKDAPGGATASQESATRSANVGIRASAVTLHSQVLEEGEQVVSSGAEQEKSERRPANVIEDTIIVPAEKKKIRLTAKVRHEELHAIGEKTGLRVADEHRYEPAPWAAWRASTHYAALKPARGIHIRYILGEESGVAILCTAKHPLGWHVLNWEEGTSIEILVQTYHLLRVHATRRLGLEDVAHVSLQGEPFAAEFAPLLEQGIGIPVATVEGPAYGGHMVSVGLAIGALQPKNESLNLARALQKAPSILQIAPWGEAAFLMSLFLSMYLVLNAHVGGLRNSLQVATQHADASTWARGLHPSKLQQEVAILKREVDPLKKFLTREISFGEALGAVADSLPPQAWLVNVAGEDLIWEKNPNKALGERYLLLTAGAPSEREGLAPPEINRTVHDLEAHRYFERILPRVKLTDVNWRQQAGRGFTVYSILAVPKATK